MILRGARFQQTLRAAAWLAATCVFTLAVCTAGIWDRLHDPFAVHNDLATSIFWIHRLADPGLFPDSLMAQYSASRTSPAIETVYRVGMLLLDPITISRLFPYPAILLLTVIGFGIGRRLGGDAGGALFASGFVVNTWFLTLGPGTSGELAPLLYAAFAYALVRRSAAWTGAVLVVAAFAYPPAALVGGLAFTAWIALDRMRGRGSLRDLAILTVSGAAALAVLWLAYRSTPSEWGPIVTRAQMAQMPEFGSFGGISYFYDTFYARLRSDTTGLEMQRPMVYMLAVALVLGVVRYRHVNSRIPLSLWLFLGSGVVWFVTAQVVMLRLLAPTKYIAQPMAITASYVATAGILSLPGRRARIAAAAAFLLAGLAISYPFLAEKEDRPPTTAVFERICELPNDVVIAGRPETMNWVAIFGKRSVFVCREAAEPYFPRYYREAARRIEQDLRAYYSADLQDVLRFCAENGVTHLLVVRSEFDEQALAPGQIYSEPFGSRIAKWIGERRTFALLEPPDKWVIYEDADAMLLAPRGIGEAADTLGAGATPAPEPGS